MFATFNRFEIQMTRAQAAGASHSGACDAEVAALLKVPSIKRQLEKIGPLAISAELKEYGAWNEEELNHFQDNCARIIWIAAGNITEEMTEKKRK